MSKTPYCKMCSKYHFERSTFYDVDIRETIYFCSDKHKNEYLNKKRDPNYKTSQDKFMDEMNEKRENDKAERHRKLKDIEDYYAKNPDGDYNNQSPTSYSSKRSQRDIFAEIQEDKANSEREAKENAERKQRAAELRSQGKNFRAFLVEFQNGVIGASVLISFALFLILFTQNEESNKADAMLINSELELIEDSVKLCINVKNYDRALVLANKLVHPSREDMEHLEFDAWDGYPKFDEYWIKKREEYKDIIFNKGSLASQEVEVKKQKVKAKTSEINTIEEDLDKEFKNIDREIDSMSSEANLEDEYKY